MYNPTEIVIYNSTCLSLKSKNIHGIEERHWVVKKNTWISAFVGGDTWFQS